MIKIDLSKNPLEAEKSHFDIEIEINTPEAILGRKKSAVTVRNDVKQSIVAMKPMPSEQFRVKTFRVLRIFRKTKTMIFKNCFEKAEFENLIKIIK